MNNYLIDTNVLLWYFWDKTRINPVKELIASINSEIFISTVSLWEIITKIRKGTLDIDFDNLQMYIKRYTFRELPVTSNYLKVYKELPPIHKAPFAHMLLAQAITCPMRLITGDEILAEYSSLVIVI